ncbi:glycosyltransferase [Polynucleobacter paneuropaeus]|uniref:glycosyltransferase n=1 Tax=Polynucleobacter paneuropaeus TaxID=2527775 RepID=UPI001314C6C6|nr:glycosyltransferase [Polynucleobacter paneuropaeus]
MINKLGFILKKLRNSRNFSKLALRALEIMRAEGLNGIRIRLIGADEAPISGYQEWINLHEKLDLESKALIKLKIDCLNCPPLLSVLMPTCESNIAWLREAIDSVQKQLYPYWELCIADDASSSPEVKSLLSQFSQDDSRIKVVFCKDRQGISEATNVALGMANGQWIALLDHDDWISEDALYQIAAAADANKNLSLIYSDEDRIDPDGLRFGPYFKGGWSPDLFYSQNFISHLGAYKKDLVVQVGGFRVGFEGSQDYDLALRCIEILEDNQIHHVPRVLYHWRSHENSFSHQHSDMAKIAAVKALNEHLARRLINAQAISVDAGYRVIYGLASEKPLVSLIIPTHNRVDLLRRAVSSILEKTTYSNYELIIIDHRSDEAETLLYLDEISSIDNVRVMHVEGGFNFSAFNNQAVNVANGSIVGLLNNDIEVISPDWLDEMVGLTIQDGAGAVGARLWYPNDTLQHGGVILGYGPSRIAGHIHGMRRDNQGYFGRAELIQNFSAVTAACLLVKKSVYLEANGLDENLPVDYNDVDFCLRLIKLGYRNIWTPYAELYHYEHGTTGRGALSAQRHSQLSKDMSYMRNRWGDYLIQDPLYSPNLDLDVVFRLSSTRERLENQKTLCKTRRFSAAKNGRLGVCAIIRNRAQWIEEWISFHHLVGFANFYIGLHKCSDSTEEFLIQVSKKFNIKIFHVEDRVGGSPQTFFYNFIQNEVAHEVDWMAFIDGDEFLFAPEQKAIGPVLDEFLQKNVYALAIHWACFGSSNFVTEPSGLIIENYRHRAPDDFPVNKHIKSVVYQRVPGFISFNNPHLVSADFQVFDEILRPINTPISPYEPSFTSLRINHYLCQSREYFDKVKKFSGNADNDSSDEIKKEGCWIGHDRNDLLDHSVESYVHPVKNLIHREAVEK